MPGEPHTCPDCGSGFTDSSALVDHALSAHVDAPTRAEGIRAPKNLGFLRAVTVIALLLGAAAWIGVAVSSAGVFDKDEVPETPGSLAHSVAVELKASGEIDDYRAVEPDEGWAVEYELDGGDFDGPDGVIRSGRAANASFEYETFLDDDLYDALEEAFERRGQAVEEQ